MHYILREDNTHNSFITKIIAFSCDFLGVKISEFSYWKKRIYFTSCVVTEKSQSTVVNMAESV